MVVNPHLCYAPTVLSPADIKHLLIGAFSIYFAAWVVVLGYRLRKRGYRGHIDLWCFGLGWHILLRGLINVFVAFDATNQALSWMSLVTAIVVFGSFPVFVKRTLHLVATAADDSTNRETRARQMAEANLLRMTELLHARQQFFSIISHELRTPAAAVLGWAELLQESNDPDLMRTGLKSIVECSTIQDRLIEDLLDQSRVYQGSFQIHPRYVEVSSIVEQVTDQFSPALSGKGLTLVKQIHFKGFVKLDEVRFKQVIWNLLSNSTKYTQRGRIEVTLREVNASGRPNLELVVEDTGRGIDPRNLRNILDRVGGHDHISETHSSQERGLGLGLSIAKHILDMHGGTMFIESAGTDRGTRVTVHIPFTYG
jgi:signal transduction histidine kinase